MKYLLVIEAEAELPSEGAHEMLRELQVAGATQVHLCIRETREAVLAALEEGR